MILSAVWGVLALLGVTIQCCLHRPEEVPAITRRRSRRHRRDRTRSRSSSRRRRSTRRRSSRLNSNSCEHTPARPTAPPPENANDERSPLLLPPVYEPVFSQYTNSQPVFSNQRPLPSIYEAV